MDLDALIDALPAGAVLTEPDAMAGYAHDFADDGSAGEN